MAYVNRGWELVDEILLECHKCHPRPSGSAYSTTKQGWFIERNPESKNRIIFVMQKCTSDQRTIKTM